MYKILMKSFEKFESDELINFLLENEVEAKFQDFASIDTISENYTYCILKINFEDKNQLEAARIFVSKNKHLKLCAYLEKMNKNALSLAHEIGCNKFCYNFDSMKHVICSSLSKTSRNKSTFTKFKGAKVLLVDDAQINLDVLKDVLSPFCLELYAFTDPRAALEETNKTKFDLIFLDISMPMLNGFELAQKIKKGKLNCVTGLIFVTGNGEIENEIKSYSLGSIAYIKKPVDIETLRAQVYGILETRALQNEIINEKENFIQMLTHDLKTPISAQIGAIRLLLDEKFGHINETQREILTEALVSNQYMLTMVRNVLAKYKYSEQAIEIVFGEHKIGEDIQEILNDFRFMLNEKGASVRLLGNLEVKVCYDEVEIKRVLNNLISNAVEHCVNGSEIKIEIKEDENCLHVSVSNKCYEICEEDLDLLFGKYASKSKKYRKVGFGLGLYICREIIEAHGGKIQARIEKNFESDLEGYGALNDIIFEFTLPKVEATNTNKV